jgi:NAD(P)-dependent dehydrogenase (short-subunit alcohol dehydrogenase family)
MAESTLFLTGASTGLGNAAARMFAARGWRVIATMRKPDDAKDLADVPGVTVMALDVTKPAQITEVAARAIAQGPIDVVFNNAGYGLAGPLEGTSDAVLVRQIDTNLLGVIRTTQAFIPHFRERRAGTFIATTSIGGLVAFPFNSTYHATKWALEGWTESIAFELARFGIRAKTVAPGGIKTDFAGRSLSIANHPAYAADAARVFGVFRDPARAASYSTAEQIAEVVYEAATDGKDQIRYVAGADANTYYAQRQAAGNEAFHKALDAAFFGPR